MAHSLAETIARCLTCMMPTESPCDHCNPATGLCVTCDGKGYTAERDRQILKTEMRKTPQGNMVPEVRRDLKAASLPSAISLLLCACCADDHEA